MASHAPHFVNSVDANASRTLLATGDDSGQVKLWRFPALPGAVPLVYGGHSAHVTAVRFSADERHLITVGGFDNAVFQWAVL
jgi:WD40 repeat protein